MASRCASSAPSRALENAEFARLGGIHRNSFINSPRLLDRQLRLKSKPNIRFAGQITGCEGYVESAAVGLDCSPLRDRRTCGERPVFPAAETALGALLGHITGGADAETFQPMNVNFGLMPPLAGRSKKADRKKAYTDRARAAFAALARAGGRVANSLSRRIPASRSVRSSGTAVAGSLQEPYRAAGQRSYRGP